MNLFNWVSKLNGFFTFYGGGDSGGGKSVSYSSNLPEYARPYYEELLKQTGKDVFQTDKDGLVTGMKPYQAYTGQRLAGMNPAQAAAQQEVAGMQTPGGFAQGVSGLTAGQQGSFGAMSQGLNQALGYQAQPLERMGMSQAPIWGQDVANYYMSPYQSKVTDIAVQEAQREADRQRSQQALGSIGRGTFGGARATLADVMLDANTQANVGKLRAQGQQDAWTQAQQQFERDRAARMGGEEKTLQAEMERRKLEEAGRQYEATMGSDLYKTGLSGLLDASKGMGAMASTQQEADLARLQAQAASGAEQQAQQQKALDLQYQQAMEARDWNQKQLEFYSNILRGNASALGSTQVQYNPAPSAASQVAGLGLAGLGLYKALGNG